MKKGSVIMLLIVAFAMMVPGALGFRTSGLMGNSGYTLGGSATACASAEAAAWGGAEDDTPVSHTSTSTCAEVFKNTCAYSASKSVSTAAVIVNEEEEEEGYPCPPWRK